MDAVEQVLAERGGLHAERTEPAARGRAHVVAAVDERVARRRPRRGCRVPRPAASRRRDAPARSSERARPREPDRRLIVRVSSSSVRTNDLYGRPVTSRSAASQVRLLDRQASKCSPSSSVATSRRADAGSSGCSQPRSPAIPQQPVAAGTTTSSASVRCDHAELLRETEVVGRTRRMYHDPVELAPDVEALEQPVVHPGDRVEDLDPLDADLVGQAVCARAGIDDHR